MDSLAEMKFCSIFVIGEFLSLGCCLYPYPFNFEIKVRCERVGFPWGAIYETHLIPDLNTNSPHYLAFPMHW
jgi:hypothetical protein